MEILHSAFFTRYLRVTRSGSQWVERMGLISMAAMGLTTLMDVIGSKFLRQPLPGSTEITAVIQIIAISGGLAFSKIDGRHIRVEFLIDLLPHKAQAALDIFSSLLGLGFFIVAGSMMYVHGMNFFNSGTKTFLLGIPLYPFALWISFCCIPMCLVIIGELFSSLDRMSR